MINIRQAKDDEDDRSRVRDLFWEYLQWANGRVSEEFGVDFDIESILDLDMAKLEIFFPPDGRLLLVTEGFQAAGIGCMKKIGDGIGEIRRMYVRPEFRGKGIGRALVEALIAEATQIGYPVIRLNSAGFMKAAHSLYRSAGFEEIEPYSESESPFDFQKHWVFMEKRL